MIIFSHKITPRLQYISGFLGKEISGIPFLLTDNPDMFKNYSGIKINYSNLRICDDEIIIVPHDLLFETEIRVQDINCFSKNNFKAFFQSEGDYPFDIFAASFYLLSRYEEYLPHMKDEYGRFAYQNSLAFKEGFLQRPLVNIWMQDFVVRLKEKFPGSKFSKSSFQFLPTYDIDEAYAFKGKSFLKNIGGAIKSILSGQWELAKKRINVMKGNGNDPYDAYGWLDEIHEKYKLTPLFFFLVATPKGKLDKNLNPDSTEIQLLIKQHAGKYEIGIHPSWASGDNKDILQKEISLLEKTCEKKITASRQHYIRFKLPDTFRRLEKAGITDDYSMGYGSINGFRASAASSFYWYDLDKEQQTNLMLHPFCFMEANSFYEQKFSAQQAFDEMMHYYQEVKGVEGKLIFIWHNSFLGTHPQFLGWRELYEEFISNNIFVSNKDFK